MTARNTYEKEYKKLQKQMEKLANLKKEVIEEVLKTSNLEEVITKHFKEELDTGIFFSKNNPNFMRLKMYVREYDGEITYTFKSIYSDVETYPSMSIKTASLNYKDNLEREIRRIENQKDSLNNSLILIKNFIEDLPKNEEEPDES